MSELARSLFDLLQRSDYPVIFYQNQDKKITTMATKAKTIIILTLISTFITCYEYADANSVDGASSSAAAASGGGAAAASAAASDYLDDSAAAAAASASEGAYMDENGNPMVMVLEGEQQEQYPDAAAQIVQENLDNMKQLLSNEVHANPTQYDLDEIDEVFADQSQWSFARYLNQRNHNWKRAYRLMLKNLRWRASIGLNRLTANDFPCDLFSLGLIFEHGRAHQQLPSGEYVQGNPMIWIRLGAIGNVIKYLERPTLKRTTSFAFNKAKSLVTGSFNAIYNRKTAGALRPQTGKGPLVEDMSLKAEVTIQYVLRAIAWWIEDWDRRHRPYQATLVLDFENTDYAFASWSIGEFLIELDDHFPDLFDQIIGFRYRSKLWSIRSPMSMFNRIFKSRIVSSAETDRKLKFVNSGPQIGRYMPVTDVEGFSTLPAHVSGECHGPIYQVQGCRVDSEGLGFDPVMWQAIRNEFYQVCKPKVRQPVYAQ